MACFLAPTAEAIIVTVIWSCVKKKEEVSALTQANPEGRGLQDTNKIPFSHKLGWLLKLLWGGSFLLAIEHVWHGEVVPWPPFLTAMVSPADIAPMLTEIAVTGTAMALLVTLVWAVMLIVSKRFERRAAKAIVTQNAEG